MTRLRSLLALLGSIRALARAEQLTLLAAAIAYYAFASLIPLVVIALAAASVLGGPAFIRTVDGLVTGVLTPETATVLESALASGDGREGATLVGLALLVWSGLRVFRGIDATFSRIYGVEGPKPLPDQLLDAALVLGTIGVAFAGAAWLGTFLPRVTPGLAGVVGPISSLVVVPVALYPLYYVYPDSDVGGREAVPGALLAGVGWTALAWLFTLYTAYAGAYQLWGVVGAVLLLLTWFYAAALLILLGAVVNAVLAGRVSDRQLQQDSLRDVPNGNQ